MASPTVLNMPGRAVGGETLRDVLILTSTIVGPVEFLPSTAFRCTELGSCSPIISAHGPLPSFYAPLFETPPPCIALIGLLLLGVH